MGEVEEEPTALPAEIVFSNTIELFARDADDGNGQTPVQHRPGCMSGRPMERCRAGMLRAVCTTGGMRRAPSMHGATDGNAGKGGCGVRSMPG